MEIVCRKCQSKDIKKNGVVYGKQRYQCKKCGHQFLESTLINRAPKDKATALSLCHLGLSQNVVSKILNTTPTSIARWYHQMPHSLPFQFENEAKIQEIEETTLRSYIKDLYIQNKENFLLVKNQYKSGHEVDIIIKNNCSKLSQNQNLTVCAFGDSILQGVVHDAQVDKYKILKENFVNISEQKLNVLWKNYAKHGSTVIEGEKSFLSHLTSIQKSDYILFSFGGNESNFDWDKISKNPTKTHKPKIDLETFHKRYIHLIQMAQKRGKTPLLFSLPPIHSENFFNSISLGRNKDNILSFLNHDIGSIYRWHSMYNLEIFKIAQERDIPIVDITTCFLSYPDYSDFICDDGVHPNQKGHQLIAKAIQQFYGHYFP